jgi:hypothetical protein
MKRCYLYYIVPAGGLTSIEKSYGGCYPLLANDIDDWLQIWIHTEIDLIDSFHTA